MWRPGNRRVRRVALALLLPALMFRAAIPAGYMPVATAGQPALVMCSGIDRHDPDDSTRPDPPCLFAASLALAPPPDCAAIPGFASHAPFAQYGDAVDSNCPAIVRAQSARAPPGP